MSAWIENTGPYGRAALPERYVEMRNRLMGGEHADEWCSIHCELERHGQLPFTVLTIRRQMLGGCGRVKRGFDPC